MEYEIILKDMYSKLKKTHDFILGPCDTDSISFCKPDGSAFSIDEQNNLIDEINNFMPGFIKYAHDGYFSKILVLKAKNYITKDEKGKIKIKGSALKSSKTEKAIKEFMMKLVDHLLNDDNYDSMRETYYLYIKEIFNMKDILRWCSKKTITEKVLEAGRTTEQKIMDAVGQDDVQMGDKIYVYFTEEAKLKQSKDWNNDHDKIKLIKRLYNTLEIFENVLDLTQFEKLHLKNKKIKEQLQKIIS